MDCIFVVCLTVSPHPGPPHILSVLLSLPKGKGPPARRISTVLLQIRRRLRISPTTHTKEPTKPVPKTRKVEFTNEDR